MNVCKINEKVYDVLVTEIEESFNILYNENTGRTVESGGRMFLFPIGTFLGHKITFQRKRGKEAEFDELFDLLCQPTSEGLVIEAVHNQTTIRYEAYVSSGARGLKRVEGNLVKWDALSVNFIPLEAQIVPKWS